MLIAHNNLHGGPSSTYHGLMVMGETLLGLFYLLSEQTFVPIIFFKKISVRYIYIYILLDIFFYLITENIVKFNYIIYSS
jgi:hypothetical protein